MGSSFVKMVPVLTAEAARQCLIAAEEFSRSNGWATCIAIADEQGELMAFFRMEGAMGVSVKASILKASTAALVKMSTTEFQNFATPGASASLAGLGLAPLIGGIPLLIDDQVLGGIGVSGAAGDEDVSVARVGAMVLRQVK
jgi:glc operon protein GlcG